MAKKSKKSRKKNNSPKTASNPVNINLYMRREIGNPPLKYPAQVSYDSRDDINLILPGTGLNYQNTLRTYKCGNMNFRAFSNTIEPGGELVVAAMQIPYYFEELGGNLGKGWHSGMFLAKINPIFSVLKKSKSKKPKFSALDSFKDETCLGKGSQDCPYKLIMGDKSKNEVTHFTFNGQVFFPLLMRNFTIIYYVADESSELYNWDHPKYPPQDPNGFVAVDAPIQYDPTLGLFITRMARVVPA